MNTGTQTEVSQLQLGAEESHGANRIYVDLRIGKIAQTSKESLPGYVPAQTKNKDGSINNFYAKAYGQITGYVTDIRWHVHTLPDGTKLSSWQITIDTTKEVFVLKVGSNDRPFERTMNCLLNVDFTRPVRFVGFMGKNRKTNKPQKMLMLSQEMGADGKPVWIQPAMDEKWLSRLVINKLKEGIELTPEEEKRVSRMADGKFNKEYPYIIEKSDGSWSLDMWTEFLFDQMNEQVIPNVKAAAEQRGSFTPAGEDVPMDSVPDEAPEMTGPPDDDDIPW